MSFEKEKAKFKNELSTLYGQYTESIFYKTDESGAKISAGRFLFSSDKSWDNMKEKIMLKLLRSIVTGIPQNMVWATGGHSAAAGHGNLFNESYSMVLQKYMKPVFEQSGIKFEVRPYGMGATSTGPEIASCIKEVFGNDFDILWWDYGMTTGFKNQFYIEYFLRRAVLNKNNPAFVAYGVKYGKHFLEAEKKGYASFVFDERKWSEVQEKIPDSEGLSETEISKMPVNLRAFKCGKVIENAGLCKEQKYSVDPLADKACNNRLYRVRWHPGWKWHSIFGIFQAFFLVELLSDALLEIKSSIEDPQVMLLNLENKENLLKMEVGNFTPVQALSVPQGFPVDLLYHGENICHTARLPSQIRYKGILTQSGIQGSFLNNSYDEGTSDTDNFLFMSHDNLTLAKMPSMYQSQCTTYLLQIDHPDWFLSNSLGQSSIILPNKAEQTAYGLPELKGFIMICRSWCGNSRCKQYQVEIQSEFVSVWVNGVSANVNLWNGCALLNHSKGYRFPSDSNGLFELKFRVKLEARILRVSSIIIW
eukprot:CAMPEP_0172441466 /NCGR_PEP_ID=MMETSP1065-20121228/2014_1 /TAXON_ID=265537 /ORGANISM="Amphiprora paludosa, Strain CCMP125" /LENGTH=533 /DNA_ID=CAMNT_0013190857 /DNA_START=33 /DNA_END=1634 /DNA_ORIENTATION=-